MGTKGFIIHTHTHTRMYPYPQPTWVSKTCAIPYMSMCAKMFSKFWSTGASSVPVLMMHQLLVAMCT